MSYIEVLKNEKIGSRDAARLIAPFSKQFAGIVQLQNIDNGLWHTVLDESDTYQEGSASSMFLYGMTECRNLRLFDVPYVETMRRAWTGLAKTILPDGRVGGVSAGTGPSGKAIMQPGDSVLLEDHLFVKHVDVLFVSPTEHNMQIDDSITLINELEPDYILPQHRDTYPVTQRSRFWTYAYTYEVQQRLLKDLQSRYHIVEMGRRFDIAP